jgi:hypothetical protein
MEEYVVWRPETTFHVPWDRIGYLESDPLYRISNFAVNRNLTCDMRHATGQGRGTLGAASGGDAVGGM